MTSIIVIVRGEFVGRAAIVSLGANYSLRYKKGANARLRNRLPRRHRESTIDSQYNLS